MPVHAKERRALRNATIDSFRWPRVTHVAKKECVLQTGRCCRARFVGVDAAARSGRIGGAAQLLLFEVANIRIRSPSVRTAGGAAILTC